MKKIILSFVFGVISVSAFSQIEAKSIRLGGSGGYSISSQERNSQESYKRTQVFVSPFIGYTISNSLVVDLMFSKKSATYDSKDWEQKDTYESIGVGLRVKKYFNPEKAVKVFSLLQIMWDKEVNEDISYDPNFESYREEIYKSLSVELGAGLEYFLAPFFSLHTHVGVVNLKWSESTDDDRKNFSLETVINPEYLFGRAGFTFWL